MRTEGPGPVSYVDLDRLESTARLLVQAEPASSFCYAIKASYHPEVLRALRASGLGASAFSELELRLATGAGFENESVVFNGVGRSGEELARAVTAGMLVNLESLAEVRALAAASPPGSLRGAGVGLRVRPSVGGAQEKYGVLGLATVDLELAADLLHSVGARVRCLAFHAVANQLDATRFIDLVSAIDRQTQHLRRHPAVRLDRVDVGGGLASRSEVGDEAAVALVTSVAAQVRDRFSSVCLFELGRFLVADAESVHCSVVDWRMVDGSQYLVVDATTNYLVPAPGHRFTARVEARAAGDPVPTVVIDRLGSEICRGVHPRAAMGDRVVVGNCGAYAGVMKERFVFSLPEVRFVRSGAVVATTGAGGTQDALAFHGWTSAPAGAAR